MRGDVCERLEVGKGRDGEYNYIVISKTMEKCIVLKNRHYRKFVKQ